VLDVAPKNMHLRLNFNFHPNTSRNKWCLSFRLFSW